jgi:hypothetical protein
VNELLKVPCVKRGIKFGELLVVNGQQMKQPWVQQRPKLRVAAIGRRLLFVT